MSDPLIDAAYAAESWLREGRDGRRTSTSLARLVAALEAWASAAGWKPQGEAPVTSASTEEALAAWALSRGWTPPGSIDVGALAARLKRAVPSIAAAYRIILREALGPAAKPASPPPEPESLLDAIEAHLPDQPLTREQLDLVERTFLASWPSWLRLVQVEAPELTMEEARAGCWYEAEQAVRARPAHLDPEAAVRGERYVPIV